MNLTERKVYYLTLAALILVSSAAMAIEIEVIGLFKSVKRIRRCIYSAETISSRPKAP